MFELARQFRFEAAHTLRREVEAEASRRIHGHSYRAEVVVRGEPDPATGMVLDLGLFERALSGVHDALDHRFLDEVDGLGPATLENLAAWIWRRLGPDLPGLSRVTVHRDSTGDSCAYRGG
ncbi:MAG: 6-carboxytetrahydropterin synthase [Alphaproteobacteria bacterium]|nr:6-carboxytetrahydropterin synthase [Alphaproteobacteria bacterium]MBV9372238.1 6-carboxytetrahydropterin synthase [Alphaproteobacteria bacterium]MBV9901651.1 6-carboxytetrahydropterin synthase [Alphaproteobacteria bacterium]